MPERSRGRLVRDDHGSHVDHRAAAITPHRLNAGALRVEDAVEVHTDHLVPGGVAVLSRWLLLAADAGIGNDNVDPTKIVGRRLHRPTDLA